ncbi:MAG: hypothetical protein ACYC69_02635 [Thermodesulfovibrionales bacterium]
METKETVDLPEVLSGEQLVKDFTHEILRDDYIPEGSSLEFFKGEFDEGVNPEDPQLRTDIRNIMDAAKVDQLRESADALREERDEAGGELYPDCHERQDQLEVLEKGLEKWASEPAFREAVVDRLVSKYREGYEAEQEKEVEHER